MTAASGVGPRRAAFSRCMLVVLSGLVLTLNLWDMHLRHSPHGFDGWLVDSVAMALSFAAAAILPVILRECVLILWGALMLLHVLTEPFVYIRYIPSPDGGATDTFFGGLIMMVQVILLVAYALGWILRRLVNKVRR